MKRKNIGIGYIGESIAGEYLQKKGYRIIERNYRTRYAEIDLIARRKSVLVFIEVRTRVGERFGSPEESIKSDKLYRLVKNAQAYVARKNYDKQYRIDAVCIVLDKHHCPERITHYKNITLELSPG